MATKKVTVTTTVTITETRKPKANPAEMTRKEYDNWLYAGAPPLGNYGSARPGRDATAEEYDNWLWSGCP